MAKGERKAAEPTGPETAGEDAAEFVPTLEQVALFRWRAAAGTVLPDPARGFDTATEQLVAETLRVHGRLLEHLAGVGPDEGDEDELTSARFGAAVTAAEVAALARGVSLPLPELVARFHLSPRERELLLLCVARAVSPALRLLLAEAHHPVETDHVSVALATELIAGGDLYAPPPLDIFGPEGALFAYRLLALVCPSRESAHQLADQLVIANDAVVNHLQGRIVVPPALRGHAVAVNAPGGLEAAVVDEEVRRELASVAVALRRYLAFAETVDGGPHLGATPRAWDGVLGVISGPAGCGKTVAVEGLAGAAGLPLLLVSTPRLAAAPHPEELVDAAFTQASLTGAVLCFDRAHALFADAGAPLVALVEGARRHRGITVLETTSPTKLNSDIESHLFFHVSLRKPVPSERRVLWERSLVAALPQEGTPDLHHLSIQYELSGSKVRHSVAAAFFEAARRDPKDLFVRPADLAEAARKQAAQRLDVGSSGRGKRLGLTDIVLPPDTEKAVRELIDACRHRMSVLTDWGFGERLATGKGIVALFSGEPGTGKSYCAEIIASELGLNMNVISIPHIMSKWVGETEKNMSRVFTQAREQNAIVVFDEADALFTKRVKVESSSDRFSNMEVNHLLQELDRFEGLAILTSNLASSMDRAFQRRVGFQIKFPPPDPAERMRIWKTLVPPQAPLDDDVDFEELARWYEFSGGLIKNTLLRAAYRARSLGRPISLDLLHLAAEEECRAAGKAYRRPEHL